MAEATGEWLANLETGNASELGTAQVESGNSLAASADAAAHGVYGARCLFGGTTNDCYAWQSFTATGTDCCRLYFRFNSDFSCPDTTGLYLLGFRSGTTWRYYVQFRVVSGAITIYRLYYHTEAGTAFVAAGNVAVSKGDWHYIEVDVLATASAAGVSDGAVRFYFDNETERSGWWLSAVANYGITFDRIYSGMSGTPVPTDGSYVDIDDVKRDATHIGAYLDDNPPVTGAVDQAGEPGVQDATGTVSTPVSPSTGAVDQTGEASAQSSTGTVSTPVPIVIDHSSVELYSSIPEAYKASIKQKWLSVPGESHSGAYRVGLQLLEALDPSFAVSVQDSGTPEGPTSDHLRASRATWGDIDHPTGWIYYYGEEDWWTSALAITRTKAFIQYAHDQGLGLAAVGLGWCWDTTWHNDPTATKDPVYKCGWAGSSVGGPQGDLPWGLDAEDSAITGNSVCLDTYLDATQQYVVYCEANGIPTKVFFNTGAIDNLANTENSYQRYLKHERIRDYIDTHGGILFDYADILCWDDAGNERITQWTDGDSVVHYMPHIATDNLLNLDGSSGAANDYHIGERGALRLGKALWVMLAMMDGWDGTPGVVGSVAQTGEPSIQASSGIVVPAVAGAIAQTGEPSGQTGAGVIIDPPASITGDVAQAGEPSGQTGAGAVSSEISITVYTVLSSTAIQIIIPPGAASGRFRVTTGEGVAVSSESFTVTT